jgi:dipeptide/tripeptide permease
MAKDEESQDDKSLDLSKPDPNKSKLNQIFSAFPRLFWVVNGFELFERGAYYATMAVLGVHIVLNLEIERDTWGLMYSFLIILLYFVPLFSAALADKIGYKTMLLVAFSLMLVGYTALTFVEPGQLRFLFVAFFFVGMGAGLFKPIISASIAHITPSEQRNMAYSIYYWMINVGAVIFPFMVGVFFPDSAMYQWVFLLSTVLVVVNMVILFMLYMNPVDPQPDLKISHALLRIVPALRDKWFAILLFIYAGFWFMFAYMHTFLPVMMVEFGRMPPWFSAPFLAVINPLTIVILGPALSVFVAKYKSLNVMMLGMVIFCIGFAMNGMSNSQFLFVAGILIFSVGEFIVHPGFISYVSKIAPKDKVAIYLACIFISTGLGQLIGGFMHGWWYNEFGFNQQRPQVYVALVVCVGLTSLIGFMWYNQQQIKQILKRDPKAEVDTSLWTKPTTMVVASLFIPIVLWGSWTLGPMSLISDPVEPDDLTDWTKYDIVTGTMSFSEFTSENSNADTPFSINDLNVIDLTFTLSWTDEGDASVRHTNEPDEFALEVFSPDGRDLSAAFRFNTQGGTGQVSLSMDFDPDKDPYVNGTGDWTATVMCGECGDNVLWRPSGGVFDQPDNGNSWNLDVTYRYYQKSE